MFLNPLTYKGLIHPDTKNRNYRVKNTLTHLYRRMSAGELTQTSVGLGWWLLCQIVLSGTRSDHRHLVANILVSSCSNSRKPSHHHASPLPHSQETGGAPSCCRVSTGNRYKQSNPNMSTKKQKGYIIYVTLNMLSTTLIKFIPYKMFSFSSP